LQVCTSNTGEIGRFVVDVKRPSSGLLLSSEGLTFPFAIGTMTFDEYYQEFNKSSIHIVPFGVRNPSGWMGSPQMYIHAASFGGKNEESLIQPGSALSGFEIISRGLPAIRKVVIDPAWVFMVDDLEAVTPEEEKRAHEVPEEIRYHMKSIGPTAPPVDMHQNFTPKALLLDIGNYVYEARNLGWITDAALYDNLFTKYLEAKQAMHDNNLGQVIAVMGEFIDILNDSTASQRTSDAYGLLYYNAEYLRNNMPAEEIHGFNIELTPPDIASVPLGSGTQFKARFTMDGEPKPYGTVWLYYLDNQGYWMDVDAEVTPADGNAGEWGYGSTDGNGEVIISVGFDEVPLERELLDFRYVQIKEGTIKFTARMAGYWDLTDPPDYPT